MMVLTIAPEETVGNVDGDALSLRVMLLKATVDLMLPFEVDLIIYEVPECSAELRVVLRSPE